MDIYDTYDKTIITYFIRKMKIVSGNILKAASILTTIFNNGTRKSYPKTALYS